MLFVVSRAFHIDYGMRFLFKIIDAFIIPVSQCNEGLKAMYPMTELLFEGTELLFGINFLVLCKHIYSDIV